MIVLWKGDYVLMRRYRHREGIATVVDYEKDMQVIAMAATAKAAVEKFKNSLGAQAPTECIAENLAEYFGSDSTIGIRRGIIHI